MRKTTQEHLASAPAAVRHALLEAKADLRPGAAAVVGRLFAAARRLHDPATCLSSEAFRQAATSESTFRTLLRTLTKHAPFVCTANAKPVSEEWYEARANTLDKPKVTKARKTPRWPEAWLAYDAALEMAKVRPVTRNRYRNSVNRCAALVAEGYGSPELGFVTAAELAEGFVNYSDKKRRIRPVTAANYIDGLIALGRFGGADPNALAAMRVITEDLRDQAKMHLKNKEERIADLMERGGFGYVADKIGEQRAKAAALPDHSAAAKRARQTAMVIALNVNKPARKSDMVNWRIGVDVTRDLAGNWELAWVQSKTSAQTEAGQLWAQVSEVLDEWILGGRPDRLANSRYRDLHGCYLLTLTEKPARKNLSTELCQQAIGVPSHDLRTLAGDYLRRHDPENAANLLASHLGHASTGAGQAYRTACSADAGVAKWRQVRAQIAKG